MIESPIIIVIYYSYAIDRAFKTLFVNPFSFAQHIAEMKLNSVVLLQIFSFSMQPFVDCSISIPAVCACERNSTLHWLWNLRNNNLCLNIIVDESIFVPKCIYDQISGSNFVIQTYNLSGIELRNYFTLPPTNCENFMFFLQNADKIFGLFETTHRSTVKRFVPFSQLFFVNSDGNHAKFDAITSDFIYENGLFVFVVESTLARNLSDSASSNELRFLNMRNVLTDETLNLITSNRSDAIRFFGTYKSHPFFDSKYKEKVFRVSLFNCAPYIIYLPDGTFDGFQYRMLKEITSSWTIEHNKCDFSRTITVPWNTVLQNVNDEISDLAMCSTWMTKQLSQYDMSTYFDFQCGTFLVPKPKLLNPASYLYLSLSENNWYGFAVSFIVMTLCFTIFTRVGRKFMDSWNDLAYVDFSRSLMDVLDAATSHGLTKFPKQHSMKFLVNRSVFR